MLLYSGFAAKGIFDKADSKEISAVTTLGKALAVAEAV